MPPFFNTWRMQINIASVNKYIQHIQWILGALFKLKIMVFNGEQEKKKHFSSEGGIEKIIPHDHSMSSNGHPRDWFFDPILTLMIVSYIIIYVAPGSDITPCNKIEKKTLVVYSFVT